MEVKIAWLKEDPDVERREWRARCFDNTLFPGGSIPFKAILKGPDGEPKYDFAAKYYALAHKAGFVRGNPVVLATTQLPPDTFDEAVLRGDLVVKAGQRTVGFCKPLTDQYYPGIIGPVLSPLSSGCQELALSYGHQLLTARGAL